MSKWTMTVVAPEKDAAVPNPPAPGFITLAVDGQDYPRIEVWRTNVEMPVWDKLPLGHLNGWEVDAKARAYLIIIIVGELPEDHDPFPTTGAYPLHQTPDLVPDKLASLFDAMLLQKDESAIPPFLDWLLEEGPPATHELAHKAMSMVPA